MPPRYETTPPWGKKRKRQPSVSSSSTSSLPNEPSPQPRDDDDRKRFRFETSKDPRHRPTPWAKHSDPLSPTSLSLPPLSRPNHPNDHDDLQQAAKNMFDWTQSDRPIEESLRHMKHIVDVCQDEASWSGSKRWNKVVATYQSLGATPEAVQDLKDAREPFWTQSRVRHASSTLATPRALADSIRTMVAESEKFSGHYLDREVKEQLMKAVERVFPRTRPVILIPDESPQQAPAPPPHQKPVAPIAQMTQNNHSAPSSPLPPRPLSSLQTPASAAPLQAPSAPSDPRLASRPPGWAPSSEKDLRPRADSLAESSSSRKSSAATLIISSPLQPSEHSPLPNPEPSQVTKPKRPNRSAPAIIESINPHLSRSVPPSPSASPKPVAAPIQFKIATGSNSAPLQRPRLALDMNVHVPRKPVENVFATPSSPERHRSPAVRPDIQPPTGPRSLPLFQAKIISKEPLENKAMQKQEILEACDYNNIPAQDATPCPTDDRTWLLHFRDIRDLQTSLGKVAILRDISIPILTYAPNQSFQAFGIIENPNIITPKVELDIITTVSRTLHPLKFTLRRQTRKRTDIRPTSKWLLVFEEPLARDSFNLDMTINGFRETLTFFGVECREKSMRCWVCAGREHFAPFCGFMEGVVEVAAAAAAGEDGQYLSVIPALK